MEYFAGANTNKGFISLFDEVFSDVKRLYILKGSSGCGKSTLMRRVAGKAQKLGLDTDTVCCSSDPNSLDGVIIPSIGVAFVDGTAPHTMDVKYPCVRETIINLGEFWDELKLLPHRDKIIALTDEKAMHYKNAYRALSAAGSVDGLMRQLVLECIDRKRLDSVAFGIAENLRGLKKGRIRHIFSTSFSSDGVKALPTFGKVNTLLRLNGKGTSELMRSLYGMLAEQETEAVVSCSFLEASLPDALFFPETKMLITTLKTPPCISTSEEKTVSSARYMFSFSEHKNRLKALEALNDAVFEEAKKELRLAKDAHNELESIYIPAMDFVRLDEYTFSLIERIFKDSTNC